MDKPSPEENVECRPGKDTVCGVCGETLRWIKQKFPKLSGWEECRFHLAAPEMFETLSAIASGDYAEGEERGIAQAAVAVIEGAPDRRKAARFGPEDRFWVVTDPTPVSGLVDVLFETSLAGLANQFKGGLRIEDNPTIFTDRAEAEVEAVRRLQTRAYQGCGHEKPKLEHDHRLLTIGGADSSFTYYPPVQDIAALPENAEEHDARWVESEEEPYIYSAKRGVWESAENHVKADEVEARVEFMDRIHRERAISHAPTLWPRGEGEVPTKGPEANSE